MSLLTEVLGKLTIPSGQVTSPALSTILSEGQLHVAGGFMDNLKVYVPPGVAEDITVQMSPVDTPAASDWYALGLFDVGAADDILTEDDLSLQTEDSDPLEDETLAQGGIVSIDDPAFRDIRLVASAPVAADRTFTLVGKLQLT